MLQIREVMYCKPGKVRELCNKMIAMAKLNEKAGMGKMRIMTDFVGDRYWTLVAEFEVQSLQAFDDMMQGKGMSPEVGKEMEKLMQGYHDLVDYGKREIYKIEG